MRLKNCHLPNIESPYSFNKGYIEKLDNYAELHATPLLFAIYFSRQNKWFLLPKSSLIEQKNKYITDFINAMAKNEMYLLGDRTIGTEPDLAIELIADTSKEAYIGKNGQTKFTIGDVRLYCAGREISDDLEKSIAFYLIRFGNWNEEDAEAVYQGKKFKSALFTYSPDIPSEEQNFCMIGELSSMVSASYSEKTTYERTVIALDTNLEPSVFSVEIPDSYKGKNLHLWQFIMQPNPDFKANK